MQIVSLLSLMNSKKFRIGQFVNKPVILLIADRNPHVREFLKREMMVEGYQIRLVKSGQELIDDVHNPDLLPDMVILDPDLPDTTDLSLVHQIHQIVPGLPIVIHTLQTEIIHQLDAMHPVIFVEKKGSSVDHLKQAVKDLLDTE
jgi:DNA-binding NtrC family response regulator